jgi:hypothetical protein
MTSTFKVMFQLRHCMKHFIKHNYTIWTIACSGRSQLKHQNLNTNIQFDY